MRKALTLLGLTTTAALFGCAPAGEFAQQSQAIYMGDPDATHTNVVGIVIQTANGVATCTGSLIAPNLVLTARHCVSELSSEALICSPVTIMGMAYTPTTASAPHSPGAFLVTTDQQIRPASHFIRVGEVIVPPDSTDVPMCGKDIALLRLTSQITNVGFVVPRLDVPPRKMDTFLAIGYGAQNGMGQGSGGRRMRGELVVEHVGRAQAQPGVFVLQDQEWLGDTGTCQGDSGGPAFDELNQSFGILSRGSAGACDSPVYTRVDSYAQFIRDTARHAAMVGNYTPPAWVTPPEPVNGQVGDRCLSDAQCDPQFQCVVSFDHRVCAPLDCTACPDNWVCHPSNQYCIPDPNMPPPPPPVEPGPEAGVSPDASGSTPDGGPGMVMSSGPCSVSHVAQGRRNPAALMVAALAALFVSRKKRKSAG